MRHKYIITRSPETDELILQELSELDKDAFSLVCEEKFSNSAILSAANLGMEALVNEIRTTNFFPCGLFAAKIAESVLRLFEPQSEASVEVHCDDADYLSKKRVAPEIIEEIEEDTADVDALLEDDFDNEFDDAIKAPGIEASVDDLLEDDFDSEFDDDLDSKETESPLDADPNDDPSISDEL
jgi:hypothetical protein